ncbi:hypothetical protein [Lyngbya aestuarii]|uniref:hypothetical protein n=1 Tax=Lyngbya aestuarii TaxID=118322 RepID=UPI00403D7156
MTSSSSINPPTANLPTDSYQPKTTANQYRPSVPISVYRELAAELQTKQSMVESLKAQNQQLVKQNQQLRQEAEKVVRSAVHLQQVVASLESASGVEGHRKKSVMPPETRRVPPPPPRSVPTTPGREFAASTQRPEATSPAYGNTLLIEEEDSRYRRTSHSDASSDVNGWLLVMAILMIVLTAFAGGFLVRRIMLNNSR